MAFTLRRGHALLALLCLGVASILALLARPGPAIALALAALFVALLGIGTSGKRAPLPRTPIEVPPEESEQREGPVTACLQCGSTEVGPGSALQGQIPGAGDQFAWVCARCGHRGTPLRFDDATAYRQFVKGLNEP